MVPIDGFIISDLTLFTVAVLYQIFLSVRKMAPPAVLGYDAK